MDSTGGEGGAVNFGVSSAAWVKEGTVGDSRTVNSAWHIWSFLWTVRAPLHCWEVSAYHQRIWTMSV